MRENIGAVNWTVAKLVSLILFAVVLVLVIWGFSTGGINPLVEKIGGKIDSVLLLLGIREGGSVGECYEKMISGYDEGPELLKLLGEEGEKAKYYICDEYCILNGTGVGSFKVDYGMRFFYVWELERWRGFDISSYMSPGKISLNELYWTLYNSFLDLLKSNSSGDYYRSQLTDIFVIWGGDYYAFWRSGYWVVYRNNGRDSYENILYEGRDDGRALDTFASVVWGDERVYWNILKNQSKRVEEIFDMVENIEVGPWEEDKNFLFEIAGNEGSNIRIDWMINLIKLKESFLEKKLDMQGGVMNASRLDSLRSILDGKEISFGGDSYEIVFLDGPEEGPFKYNMTDKIFILRGNAEGYGDKNSYAVWDSGRWYVFEHSSGSSEESVLVYRGSDDDVAIDYFASLVWEYDDDSVFYSVVNVPREERDYEYYSSVKGSGYLKYPNVKSLISNEEGLLFLLEGRRVEGSSYGGENDLDSMEKLIRLKDKFNEIEKNIWLEVLEEEDLYKVMWNEEVEPDFVFKKGGNEDSHYGLMFKPYAFNEFWFGGKWRKMSDQPLVLVEKIDNRWREVGGDFEGNEGRRNYRLPKEYFKKFKAVAKSYEFLRRYCV